MKTPSYEPAERSRLLPRISFRTLFALTTLGAVFAAIGRAAGGGAAIATALLVSLAFIATVFAAFVVVFLISWSISLLWYHPEDETQKGSPFSQDQLPPQILPPRETRS